MRGHGAEKSKYSIKVEEQDQTGKVVIQNMQSEDDDEFKDPLRFLIPV